MRFSLTRLLALASMATALSACSHMNQRDRDTATGAVIGGAAGAVLTGGSTVGTVGGAVVGGVIGDRVGKDEKRKNDKDKDRQ